MLEGPKITPAAVQLETFRHLFTALTEEMGAALRRAAFSPNIKERRDYSCALFSPAGVAVAVPDLCHGPSRSDPSRDRHDHGRLVPARLG